MAGSTVLVWLEPAGAGFLGGFVAASAAGSRLPTRVGAVLTGATLVAFTAAGLAADRPVTSVLIAETGLVAFYSAGRYARRLRGAPPRPSGCSPSWEPRAALAEAAGLAERQRLAREMHDVLAHSLSGLSLQLEGARMLVAERIGRPAPDRPVDRARAPGPHRAWRRPGRPSACCATTTCPDRNRLPALAEQFDARPGVPCDFAVSGQPHPLGTAGPAGALPGRAGGADQRAQARRRRAGPAAPRLRTGGTRLIVEDFAASAARPPTRRTATG